MADCGICLDALRNPVSIPCGHVHCERCLRSHISSGTDALKSTCPTCRKPFHTATPDFTFVPQKYHDFILPSVRRIYLDVPSVAALRNEIGLLTQRFDTASAENGYLRRRYAECKDRLETMASERRAIAEQEEQARQEADDLRKKYDSLKKKYREARLRDDDAGHRSIQNLDTSQEILPKEEECPVSLQDLQPPRPIRPLPSRLLGPKRILPPLPCRDEKASQFIKRQRTHRHSDVGCHSRLLDAILKYEDEEDE